MATYGATNKVSRGELDEGKVTALTIVATSSSMALTVAIYLVGNVALSSGSLPISSSIDGTSLRSRTDESAVAHRYERSSDAVRCGGADTMLGGVLSCGGTVVHHECIILMIMRGQPR